MAVKNTAILATNLKLLSIDMSEESLDAFCYFKHIIFVILVKFMREYSRFDCSVSM